MQILVVTAELAQNSTGVFVRCQSPGSLPMGELWQAIQSKRLGLAFSSDFGAASMAKLMYEETERSGQ